MKFEIEGGYPLYGEVEISGSKNAALKMVAATLLADGPCTILNVPEISDIKVMLEIIKKLGGKVQKAKNSLVIDSSSVKIYSPPPSLVRLLRASVVFIGPLLARFGRVEIPSPGGDLIGARPIDTHLNMFRQFGVKVSEKNGLFYLEIDKLKGQRIVLEEMSVSATENAMLFATLCEGETEIRVAACEPEIEDLAVFLNKMGAKIKGAGTHVIKIKGVKKLKGNNHQVIPDRIEAGTFIIASAVSKGEVEIKNINPSHLDLFLNKLKAANVNFKFTSPSSVLVKPSVGFKSVYIDTRPYPGFPTDLQAPFAVLLTQAKGTSMIFETLYENRFNYTKELSKMGASLEILDPHRLLISGPTPLFGKRIVSYDIRAGASLVIAALIASGKSILEKVELIDRGYEKIDQKLKKLNAKIKRIQ